MAVAFRKRGRAKAKARRVHPSQAPLRASHRRGSSSVVGSDVWKTTVLQAQARRVGAPLTVAHKPVGRTHARLRSVGGAVGTANKFLGTPVGQAAAGYAIKRTSEAIHNRRERGRRGGVSAGSNGSHVVINLVNSNVQGGGRGRGRRYRRDRRGRFS